MTVCLLIQPIHEAGIELLRREGIEVRQASAVDMETVAREITDADAAISRTAGLDARAMRAAGRLKVLGNHGIGFDTVDLACATEIGLPVVYAPTANIQSVAEHAVLQMLGIARRVREADRAIRAGDYDMRYTGDFRELFGKTLAIIGFGQIGRRTAEVCKAAFAMRVIVHDPYVDEAVLRETGAERAPDLATLLGEADVVSLHMPLTPETRNLINRETLALMKPTAILINTSRGGLIETAALIEAVTQKRIAGAATDVFDQEPPPPDHPLFAVDEILLSPHMAGSTQESRERLAVMTATQVVDVLQGRRPAHLVNPDVWERRRR